MSATGSNVMEAGAPGGAVRARLTAAFCRDFNVGN
jgi:hypothetical protein